MTDLYKSCTICPRACGVNRLAGETGFCGETAALRAAAAVIHRGEEPPLVGTGGSGTIFISGCNLGCVYCQNYQVSQGESRGERIATRGEWIATRGARSDRIAALGGVVCAEEFAAICAALRGRGAENINIVTGSHAVPGIVEGIIMAKEAGALEVSQRGKMPILWNSSGYDSLEMLELLKEHIDIFLPDLKTLDGRISAKFSNAPDYPQTAEAAIRKMIDIVHEKSSARGELAAAREKVIIRHLILPGYLESTRSVLRWFADNAKGRAMLSLMTQYTPIPGREKIAPNRYVRKEDYETVMGWLEEFGIEDGFCQELVTGSEWLPDFTRTNPFPSKLSVPVWPTSRT